MLKKRLTPDKLYVDCSFFVATQITNHPHHKRSSKLLQLLPDVQLYFSLLTIDEIMYTLSKFNIPRNEIFSIIKEKIISIQNTRIINYNSSIAQLESYINIWNETGMQPRDALHACLMKTHNIPCIATFDRDFRKIEKKLGIEVLTLKIAQGVMGT